MINKILSISLLTLSSSLLTPNNPTGIISTVAGGGKPGYNGDGIKATTAQLNENSGVAVDDSGNVYIADSQNNRIRKVYKKNGKIATIAGTGEAGFRGDGGPATDAQLTYPICVRVDGSRNVYFSDAGNAAIRKIDATTGKISTLAGTGQEGFGGDSGKATNAYLHYPVGICIDKNGNLFIADQSNNVIRKIDAASGIITTVAGSHKAGRFGDGGPAKLAQLNNPTGVAVDNSGKIFIADFKNNLVRMVNENGIISTLIGTGDTLFNGFTGNADTMHLFNPAGVAVDSYGNLFIADAGNGVVREVLAGTKKVLPVTGTNNDGFNGDGGLATHAQVRYPFDIAIDKTNNVFIADLGNSRVRKITIPVARQ